MKKLLSAIAAALRSSVSFVWTRCRETGKLIMTTVASIGASPSPASQYAVEEEPAPAESIEYATAADIIQPDDGAVDTLIEKSIKLLADIDGVLDGSPGDDLDRINRICKYRADGHTPPFMDYSKLSNLHQDWLNALTPEMQGIVALSSRQEIKAHIKGTKAMRGVIRCDKESLVDWDRACEIEAAREAYEIETAHIPGEPEWARGRLAVC